MERRVLIAIFLSFVVLYAYQALFVPAPRPVDPSASAVDAPLETAVAPGPVTPPEPTAQSAQSVELPDADAPAVLISAEAERKVRIETDQLVAVFTNRGAQLESYRLKGYLDDHGEPQELVLAEMAATHPLPFAVSVDDPSATRRLNTALFAVREAPASSGGTTVRFEYSEASGLHAVKEFHLVPSTYEVEVRVAVSLNGTPLVPTIHWGPALASTSAVSSRYVRRPGGVEYVNGALERLAPAALAEQPVREGDFRYVGVEDHYFLTIAVAPGVSRATFQPVSVPPPPGSELAARPMVAWSITPATTDAQLTIFAGPKDFDLLANIDRELVRSIDFGIFAFLVVPLLRSLKWINGFIGNYGLSIVTLTILINAVMFPLRHKSVVSMRKMQEIQPEAKAIQERYAKLKATDPAKQKMNQELMALYRERGVNPAGGCVPMLLTFPVLLAFYSLLTVSIELRGAPFFGWIHDLSVPDPFYVTPVLMGATQFWQTRLNPQVGTDPVQQKMMQFMPLMFMIFFIWAPAGVVLYWFISNLWGIGQQYATNYLIGPPKVHAVRPSAERQTKQTPAH